jgi:hypothetical protein
MKLNDLAINLAIGLRNYGIEATVTENRKNNGIVQQGIILRRGDERVAPVLYLNQFFEKYKRGDLSVDDILSQIIVEYEKLPTPNIPDLDTMMSSTDFINQINIRLVNEPQNRKAIESRNLVFHKIPDTDLVVLFYATVISDNESSGSIAITEDIMRGYLPNIVDGDELFEMIVHRKNDSVKIESINEVVERMMMDPPFPMNEKFLYVLTNKSMCFGAGAVLTDIAKKVILEHFPNGQVTLIPSSVHETLLLETRADEDLDTLREMVHSVNRSEVSVEEFLSDNVFHYDANTGELTIAE